MEPVKSDNADSVAVLVAGYRYLVEKEMESLSLLQVILVQLAR